LVTFFNGLFTLIWRWNFVIFGLDFIDFAFYGVILIVNKLHRRLLKLIRKL